jgi:hypothetical protein
MFIEHQSGPFGMAAAGVPVGGRNRAHESIDVGHVHHPIAAITWLRSARDLEAYAAFGQ